MQSALDTRKHRRLLVSECVRPTASRRSVRQNCCWGIIGAAHGHSRLAPIYGNGGGRIWEGAPSEIATLRNAGWHGAIAHEGRLVPGGPTLICEMRIYAKKKARIMLTADTLAH